MHSTYLNRAKAMPLWEAVVVIAPAGEHDIFAGDIQRVEQREDGEPEQAGHHEVLETKKDSQHCRGQGINNRWEEFECEIKRITSTRLTPQTIGSIESMRTGGGGVGWRTARPAHLILLKGGEHFLMNFRYSYHTSSVDEQRKVCLEQHQHSCVGEIISSMVLYRGEEIECW